MYIQKNNNPFFIFKKGTTNLHPNSSNQRPHRRTMRGGIDLLNRPLPALPELVLILTAIILPDTVGIGPDDLRELLVRRDAVQNAQVADEDALELRGVAVAVVRVARFADDVRVRVGQLLDGRFGDARRRLQVVGGVGGGAVGAVGAVLALETRAGGCRGAVQLDESAQDDALVVGPAVLFVSINQSIYVYIGNRVDLTYTGSPLFVQKSVRPSLIVPFSLMKPTFLNQSHWR